MSEEGGSKLPFVEEYVLFSSVGFKGNLSLLDVFFDFCAGGGNKWKQGQVSPDLSETVARSI